MTLSRKKFGFYVLVPNLRVLVALKSKPSMSIARVVGCESRSRSSRALAAPGRRTVVTKHEVGAFWEAEACGERYGPDHDRIRYEREPEIAELADFASASNRRVLEIGTGMGADLVRWCRAGARTFGVDLTERAIRRARARLSQEGLRAHVQVADAEALPFPDDHFDIVYSWGVLHHTPDPLAALDEARRVLKPGGRLKVMMYHRRSCVALAAWLRFCLLRLRPLATLADAVAHLESPGTRAFVEGELRAMMTGLDDVDIRPRLTYWDRKWLPGVAKLLGDRFGWFLLIETTKPG